MGKLLVDFIKSLEGFPFLRLNLLFGSFGTVSGRLRFRDLNYVYEDLTFFP